MITRKSFIKNSFVGLTALVIAPFKLLMLSKTTNKSKVELNTELLLHCGDSSKYNSAAKLNNVWDNLPQSTWCHVGFNKGDLYVDGIKVKDK